MSTQLDRRQLWESRIAAYRASGQKATAWCTQNQINRRQLYNWMRKFADEGSGGDTAPWVAIEVREQPVVSSSLVIQVGAVTIEVRSGYDAALLADVVRTLKTVC
ncbi:helix-turn-helix domain-containing protein [Paenibacillus sp. PL2-23]|uniref:IS66 family insertion sequence element accessory protein TnpA n=1 Tax=Paenibacillus sp. PL2-23 TaxID=2100729 RepID=UPI0030F7E280